MAKAPRPRAERRPGLIVKVDDQQWTFRQEECTPKDIRDLRKSCGVTLHTIMQALVDGQMDLDYAAGLVMLARRQTEGSWVNFDHVTLTYESRFEVEPEEVGSEDDDDSPEA